MTAQESNNLVIESPYPRTVALMGGDLRPKPKPIGVRLAADFWTLLIGFSYSLLSLLTHWSVIVILVVAFAWRAFRVERMKVDFAPRTIALALVAWVPIGLISKLQTYDPEYGQSLFATFDPAVPIALVSFALILALWGASIVWRRLTRVELAPAGSYEGWRSGVAWFVLPAILFYCSEFVGLFESINLGVVVLTVLTTIVVGSALLWQTRWERIATGLAGIALFGLFINASGYLPNVFDGWGPTARVDSIAGISLIVVAGVMFILLAYRNKKILPADSQVQFNLRGEE